MGVSHEADDIFPMCKFRLAVIGKGGVGKTVIAAMVGRHLREKGQKVLLVDADPAMGLVYMFGVDPIKTIGSYRDKLLKNHKVRQELESATVKDILVRETLIHLDGRASILVMGKDESNGCFCGINDLLKYGIGCIAKDYEVMVIDCEAGLEQVKRRVLHSVNILLVISDMTARSMKTARQLADIIAQGNADIVLPEKAGLVINRYKEEEGIMRQIKEKTGLDLVTTVPEDKNIFEIDTTGGTIADLHLDAPSYVAVTTMLNRLLVSKSQKTDCYP
jgi:CO dehydrogenase maturation factor